MADRESRSVESDQEVRRTLSAVPYLLVASVAAGLLSLYVGWQASVEYGVPFPGIGSMVGFSYLVLVSAFALPLWWRHRRTDD